MSSPIIYTSYFAKLKHVLNPISISRFTPAWYEGPVYKQLAPTTQLLMDYKAGLVSIEQYTERYNTEILSQLTQPSVFSDLFKFYPLYNTITLLCYEKSSDFCHRHLVSKWLNSYGFTSYEFK